MSDHSLKRLIVLVAGCLVAVIATGAVLGSRSVATDLTQRSVQALEAAGLGDVRVDFQGREAELRDGNDVESRLAASLVRALPGVRRVEVEREPDRFVDGVARFELDRSGDDVEISGAVRSPDDAAGIKVAVATSLRTTITGDVTVVPGIRSASWVSDLPDVFEIVAAVDRLELDISGDGTVRLSGVVDDDRTRSRIARRLAAALPDLDLVSSLEVRAPTGRGD